MPAIQMPYSQAPAKSLGRNVFRKQILRVGEIPYQGKRLKFDRSYLQRAVTSFNAGVMDQVPFVVADDANAHPETMPKGPLSSLFRKRNPSAPDRYRGEVKALELTDDGIDAIVELTDDGAELVRKNPKLGVSARLVPDVERDGEIHPVVVEHVCGTLNPRVHGMRPWETVSVRSLSQSEDQTVIDLSEADYVPQTETPTLTDDQLKELTDLKPDERAAKVAELLGESTSEDNTDAPNAAGGKKPRFPNLRKLFGISDDQSEEDLDVALGKLIDGKPEAKTDEPATPDLAGANLSDAAKKAIDLANSDAATARADASKARRETAEARWETRRKELATAGVPPVILDLCEPYFKDGRDEVVDLSEGEKFDVGETLGKILDNCKGFVDLSKAKGSDDEDDDEVKEAKELASDEAWETSV